MNSCDRLRDCLKDEKYLTSLYNTCAHGLEQPGLRQMALEHLQDSHRGAERIAQLLRARGWDGDHHREESPVGRAARALGLVRED